MSDKRREEAKDAIGNALEAQKHRYNPGHFTGGQIHPMISARRPNKYGYYLIAYAVLVLVIVVGTIRQWTPQFSVLVPISFLLLVLFAGIKLIRKRARSGGGK